ncbi:hypothetical protein [Streptomyces sp. NPDC006691]|uniref:hypothetical protein n=1 Tax=Streptomyces sp. NPDC006691 TaxID=3364757 RepID=UPI003691A84B
MRSRPWLTWSIAGAIAALCLGLAPLLILLPLLGRDYTDGSGGYAGLLAGFGAGTVLGAVAAVRWSGPRRGVAGQLGVTAVGLPMGVLAMPGSAVVAVVSVVVAAAGYGLFGVVWTTALQDQVPSEVLGRVAAVDTALGLGAMPLGYLLGGQLAQGIGLHQSLVPLAPSAVVAGLAPLAVSSVRGYGLVGLKAEETDPAHSQTGK